MEEDRSTISMPIITPVKYLVGGCNPFKRLWYWMTYTRHWRIMSDWYYTLPNGVKVKIPSGFIFDGASVPRFFRNLLSPTGILFLAAILHDYAYKYDKLVGVNADGTLFDYMPNAGRAFWDKIFKEVADATNGMIYINKVAWFVLRVGGFVAWNRHRKIIEICSKN